MPAIRVGSTRGVSRSFRSRSERTTLPPRQDLLVLFRQRRPARFTRNPTIPSRPARPSLHAPPSPTAGLLDPSGAQNNAFATCPACAFKKDSDDCRAAADVVLLTSCPQTG